jgi:hypothetical protein
MLRPWAVDMYMVSPSGVNSMPWLANPAGALHTTAGFAGSAMSTALAHICPEAQ